MKIDAYTHVLPRQYLDRITKLTSTSSKVQVWTLPELTDMEARLRVMDEFGIDQQVITLASPPIEAVGPEPKLAAELARMANDGIAEIAAKHPTRFIPIGAVALNGVESALKEAERCVNQLGMKGILIYTNVLGRALDAPEYRPFFAMMAAKALPIWIHPARGSDRPDYTDETESKHDIAMVFGWSYETTVAMTRLVFAGILDEFPAIKIVTHHAGAMVPLLEKRVASIYSDNRERPFTYRRDGKGEAELQRQPIEYFRMFHVDTVGHGSLLAVMGAYAFYGADHLLFGTDVPYDFQGGRGFTRSHLAVMEQLLIPPREKELIFHQNLTRLIAS